MAPSFSRSGNQTFSVAVSPEPAQAARAFFALPVHRVSEGGDVDADAARLQRVLGEIERKAIGVVQRERGVAVEHVALLQGRALLVEDGKPALQRLAETGLLQPQGFLDQVLGAHQFRIGLAHLAHQCPDQPMHQRVPGAEQLRMAHRAAHDPAQHIAAAFVRGQHAVGDQERRGAQMVGDHAQRGLLLALRIGAGQFGDGADQGDEQIDVVIVVLALQHRGDALEACAGIDRGLRQRIAHAALELLELHEHEVPDLDEAVAVLLGRAGGPPRSCRRGRRRFPSTGRRGRCRPSARNCRSRRSG